MTKVARWFVVAGLVFALVLPGCGAPSSTEPTKPTTQTSASQNQTGTLSTLTREQQLVEAAKKEGGEVNFWLQTINERETFTKLFESRYPFLKLKIWDGRGAEILARIGEEAKAGRPTVDVVLLGSEIAEAKNLGMLSEYEFPNVVGWSNQPNHNFSRALGGTARVIVYNTNTIPPSEVPKTYDDLKSTKWAGKTFMSTSGEDTVLFWAYLWREDGKLNWEKSATFWGDVAKNTKPLLVSGFGGPMARLAAGEVSMFLPVATPSAMRLLAQGAPIAIAPMGSVSGDGGSIGLVKNAPHPNSAKLFIDWLTSPEGVLAYCNPTQYIVLDPKLVDKSATAGQLKKLNILWDPLPPELLTAENIKRSSDYWLKSLGYRK